MAPLTPSIMTTIAELLTSLNLSQYQNLFLLDGLTNVGQLLSQQDAALEACFAEYGLLKGHSLKLRHAIDQLRGRTSPNKPPSLEVSPSKADKLAMHTSRLSAKLAEIDHLRKGLDKSKAAILALDVEKYRSVLDQIEELQKAFRSEEREEDGERVSSAT